MPSHGGGLRGLAGRHARLLGTVGALGIAECFEGLAAAADASRKPLDAARLIGAADVLRAAIGAPLPSRIWPRKRAVAVESTRLAATAWPVLTVTLAPAPAV